MGNEIKSTDKSVDLGDDIKLVYRKPEVFSKYYSVYYGHRYSNYYFRSSTSTLLDWAKYLDCGYFILKNNKIIGGVFIKPNFMADLFVVPPYNDYEFLGDKMLEYLKNISEDNKNILLQEVIEEFVPFFKSRGCVVHEEGYWMIRPTEEINPILSSDYEAKPVTDEDKDEIGDLIVSTYNDNPGIKVVHSKEEYIKSIENVIKKRDENEIIYNSSRVIVSKVTKEIVGVALYMEFEGYPLVTNIAVSPRHQGKGIGSYLLKYSIGYTSKKYSSIRLYVYKRNPAMKVYEHLGFIKYKTLNDMYLIHR